ncbi:MAG TPA: DUF2802 domain-containing protein [Syntrophales bacterium]|mgnify:CR=1 FL=1|jgi:hypothetical protein|nr:DUF2802 domain-containing protein [Syntrophales bacterium]HRT61034.1 DUF2802 domain-containing protein [Syntrophales bacterium]
MNQQAFFIIQILADIALLAAIVFFIYRIREDSRRRSAGIDPSMLEEFKKLLAESQQGSANLVEAMDEGKKALRKIARVLDEKESRLRKIIEQPEAKPRKAAPGRSAGEAAVEAGFAEAVRMAEGGASSKEISKQLGLPEGEVSLILDLHQRRREALRS